MTTYAKQITEPIHNEETGIFRNVDYLDELGKLPTNWSKSIVELFEKSVKLYPNREYLGKRQFDTNTNTFGKYIYQTYEQVHDQVLKIASGLYHLLETDQLFGDEFTSIALFSINRPEWMMADLAAGYHKFATVGLFDTLNPDTTMYILNQTQSPILITSKEKIPFILSIADKLDYLKIIVSMDSLENLNQPGTFDDTVKRWNQTVGKFQLLDWDQLIQLGTQYKYPHHLPQPDDLITICYTSGTTGNPKGVMLTHYNLVLVNYYRGRYFDNVAPETSVHISYMPLSHCYERNCQYRTMSSGGKVGFYSGNITRIFEDIQLVQPTEFASVPRLMNKIRDVIASKTIHSKGIFGSLTKIALKQKYENYLQSGQLTHPIWDRIIYSQIKNLLGGQIAYINTGSAPISKSCVEFLRLSLACPVNEGYGTTETSALCSVSPLCENISGSVGAPLGICEVKLVSVPEMNYFVSDKPYPRGELLIRGDNIFKGYYTLPEKTAEAIDKDGFYRSGDICHIDERGLITIIDRKSSFFKLSQGEFITPERVENALLKHPVVQLTFLAGIGTESTTVAIVVPDPTTFLSWCEANVPEKKFTSIQQACSNNQVKNKLLIQLTEICIEAKLAKYEIPSNIYLEPQPFSIELGLLTPTSKLCRPKLKKYYENIIKKLYLKMNNSKL